MSYLRQYWINGPEGDTPLDEDRLNHIETGLHSVSSRVDELENITPGASDQPLYPVGLMIWGDDGDPMSTLPGIIDEKGLVEDGSEFVLIGATQSHGVYVYTESPPTLTRSGDIPGTNGSTIGMLSMYDVSNERMYRNVAATLLDLDHVEEGTGDFWWPSTGSEINTATESFPLVAMNYDGTLDGLAEALERELVSYDTEVIVLGLPEVEGLYVLREESSQPTLTERQAVPQFHTGRFVAQNFILGPSGMEGAGDVSMVLIDIVRTDLNGQSTWTPMLGLSRELIGYLMLDQYTEWQELELSPAFEYGVQAGWAVYPPNVGAPAPPAWRYRLGELETRSSIVLWTDIDGDPATAPAGDPMFNNLLSVFKLPPEISDLNLDYAWTINCTWVTSSVPGNNSLINIIGLEDGAFGYIPSDGTNGNSILLQDTRVTLQ